MTKEVTYSRRELYDLFKEEKPELVKKHFSQSTDFAEAGAVLLVAALATALLYTAVTAGISNGFEPSSVGFYKLMFSIVGGVSGTTGVIGLILMAVGYYRKRTFLDERLTVRDINALVGEMLIDPSRNVGYDLL